MAELNRETNIASFAILAVDENHTELVDDFDESNGYELWVYKNNFRVGKCANLNGPGWYVCDQVLQGNRVRLETRQVKKIVG